MNGRSIREQRGVGAAIGVWPLEFPYSMADRLATIWMGALFWPRLEALLAKGMELSGGGRESSLKGPAQQTFWAADFSDATAERPEPSANGA